jgi:hypothetical protein
MGCRKHRRASRGTSYGRSHFGFIYMGTDSQYYADQIYILQYMV